MASYKATQPHRPDSKTTQPRSLQLDPLLIYILAWTGDCGPDQRCGRAVLHTILLSLPMMYDDILLWDCFCFMHQFHLICAGALALVDKLLAALAGKGAGWKYFSSVAKVIHSWRNHAKEMMTEWRQHHPEKRQALVLPPVAIASRWGSVNSSEDYLLDATKQKTVPILETVLLKRSTDAIPVGVPADGLDETTLEETKAYSAKLTKWAKGALSAGRDPIFWFCIQFMNHTRAPLIRFYKWLCKSSQDAERGFVDLATGKAESILTALHEIIVTSPTWISIALIANDCMDLDPTVLKDLRCCAITIACYNAAVFFKRIVEPLRRTWGRVGCVCVCVYVCCVVLCCVVCVVCVCVVCAWLYLYITSAVSAHDFICRVHAIFL
jgi:hypothetical protein